MRIGDLDKLLELQKPAQTSDSMGGFTTTYATEYTVWGAIWPVSAKEQIQAGQMSMTITHRIRIYYNSELKSNWRLKYKTRYFNLLSAINQNESNKMLDLLCKEVEA